MFKTTTHLFMNVIVQEILSTLLSSSLIIIGTTNLVFSHKIDPTRNPPFMYHRLIHDVSFYDIYS